MTSKQRKEEGEEGEEEEQKHPLPVPRAIGYHRREKVFHLIMQMQRATAHLHVGYEYDLELISRRRSINNEI